MTADELRTKIHEAADFLRARGAGNPEIGMVLGTGLNGYAECLEDPIVIPYPEIPHFHKGAVDSHKGQVVYGKRKGKTVMIMAGRYHYYESMNIQETVFPVRVMAELGIRRFIATNAAGCVNREWHAGQLMIISDHINLSGVSPLIGPNLDEYGPRFPDMTYAYTRELREKLLEEACREGIDVTTGVYAMMSGPAFETPAEIRFVRTIGGDAVGMSTVPEVLVAGHAGLEIIGVSFLSNMAAGVLDRKLTGEEVTEASRHVAGDFAKLIDMAITV